MNSPPEKAPGAGQLTGRKLIPRVECHAGCGEGDEINFLELHEHLLRSNATTRFLEMAGVAQKRGSQPQERKSNNETESLIDWQACVEAFTAKHVERLAKWRDYSIEF